MRLSDLPTPSFVVNRAAFVSNCEKVKRRTELASLALRPHVKTHKTAEGAYIQAFCQPPPSSLDGRGADDANSTNDCGTASVNGFVASTIPEIKMLLDAAKKYKSILDRQQSNPFLNVIYAVPISEAKLIQIGSILADPKLENLGHIRIYLLIDHPSQVDMIERVIVTGLIYKSSSTNPSHFLAFLKLDTGYHRAGVPCDARGLDVAMKILRAHEVVHLAGLYTHCGHAYDTNDEAELDKIARSDLLMILKFIEDLREGITTNTTKDFSGKDFLEMIDNFCISVGSTPSLFHHIGKDRSAGLEQLVGDHGLEIHPGNYTLFDRQQLWTGAAEDESCVAGRIASRVIGHYEDRRTIMLDAGATALTKDSSPQGSMCAVTGRPDLECYKMSQEVTLMRPKDPSASVEALFEDFPLGSTVTLLPNHSCLSAACFDRYYIIDDKECAFAGDQEIIDEWVPVKGW